MKLHYWLSPTIAVTIIAFVQFSTPHIVGADGYLHARMAQMVSQTGLLTSLPQAKFSWFVAKFADKDFLYHLYLIPFQLLFSNLTLSTKIAAVTASSLLFITFFIVCRQFTSARLSAIFTLLLLFSGGFLRDISEARPFVFAIIFILLWLKEINSVRPSTKKIFLIAAVYGMTHLSAYMLPLFSLILFISQISSIPTKSIFISTLLGWLSSFILHPNFPNNIYYFYLNGIIVPLLAAKTGVLELAAEFFPLSTRESIQYFPILFIGIVYSLLHLQLTRNSANEYKLHTRQFSLLIVWVIFFGLALISRKNYSLAHVTFLLWLATVIHLNPLGKHIREKYLLIIITLAGVTPAGIIQTSYVTSRFMKSNSIYNSQQEWAASQITRLVPTGETVFHANWSDSQFLIGLSPNYSYFVTLDPIYMYTWNKDLYQTYRNIAFAHYTKPDQVLKNLFNTSYGYVSKDHFGTFISQIKSSPETFQILSENQLGLIFKTK